MKARAPDIPKPIGIAALVALLAGCSPEPVESPFSRSGEMIALSGGDAGAGGACFTCHGREGEGDGNLVPRLAGLDSGYLARQLELFATGQRHDPQMYAIAKRLSGEDRLRAARYYAALPWPSEGGEAVAARASCGPTSARLLYFEGDASRGLVACAACHGEDGAGRGPGNPPLAGQPAPYIAEQLRKWRSGERYGDPGHVMHDVALELSAREVRDLAALAPAPASRNLESPAICP
ncbi:c-type cytochrome [Stakelama tenebrarum]|uniref:C-type cytochrome n=1 Tax=Stakelama tenebrarum TaxID=2711215 RepID=A0A6G6Y356_9SPHN|nr:c-type cytochrome [Sphingosinithalassobacter tenebrarum]QIG79355.1 c-type cytochrome [Sphingosinithalassobacter tenebrarum]